MNKLSYITTYLKKDFDPLTATAEDVDIQDIAHALHLICRANGHFPHFYSVAQHSINCAKEASARGYSERVQLGCLLHDASEAYMSDVTRPVKQYLHEYLKAEDRLQNVIFDKWINPLLTDDEKALISEVDDAVSYYEFMNLMGRKVFDKEPCIKSTPDIEFEDFSKIKSRFLRMFNILTDNKPYVGVDWMNGKWIACELCGTFATYKTFSTIEDLCREYENIPEILIDIPVGLPESAEESLLRPDAEARKYLKNKNRKSSIFPVPFRQLVYAENTAEMWELNKKLGAKLTVTGAGILPCVRQADSFLQSNPQWKNRLVESHPECAFQSLNNGNGIETSKHTDEGLKQRKEILALYVSNIEQLLSSISKKYHEDILDALCLAVTSKVGYVSIPQTPKCDKTGLPMRIVVANI